SSSRIASKLSTHSVSRHSVHAELVPKQVLRANITELSPHRTSPLPRSCHSALCHGRSSTSGIPFLTPLTSRSGRKPITCLVGRSVVLPLGEDKKARLYASQFKRKE
ncbi:unnamed protein product, partial [Mycena citricolor]